MEINCPKYAKVKFIDDGFIATISVSDIIEFEERAPQNDKDYEKNKIYTCWYKDEMYPTLAQYGVQIGALCDKADDEDRRLVFALLDQSLIDSYYEDSFENSIDEKGKMNKGENDKDDKNENEDQKENIKDKKESKCETELGNIQNSKNSQEENEKKSEKKKKKKIEQQTRAIEKQQEMNLIEKKLSALENVATHSDVVLSSSSNLCTDYLEKTSKECVNDDIDKINLEKFEKSKEYPDNLKKLEIEINKLKQEIIEKDSKIDTLTMKCKKLNEDLENVKVLNLKLQKMLFLEDNKCKDVQATGGSPKEEENEPFFHSTPTEEEKRKHDNSSEDFESDSGDTEEPQEKQKIKKLEKSGNTTTSDERESEDEKTTVKCIKYLPDEAPNKMKFLTTFTDEQSGEKMKYIRHGLVIERSVWNNICLQKTASMFCKKMLHLFYDDEEIVKRCVKEGENIRTPE